MTRFVTILADDFADWETALLNAVGRGFYGVETAFATPGGTPVVSAGGMKVAPDLAVADIDPGALDVLLICGGGGLERPDAPDLTGPIRAAHQAGKIVGGICAGTLQLARAGLLDTIPHTSNSKDYLIPTGYRGAALYRDQKPAVLANRIVTAAGTSPVSFMEHVMEAVGLNDGNLQYYLGLHAAQFAAARQAA